MQKKLAAPGTSEQLHFNVHASVIFQLGESLISDEIQALIELVKNSYDANASYVNVVIDTQTTSVNSTGQEKVTGTLSVEDDGDGMDRDTIIRGWLTISNSIKRQLKRELEGKANPKGGRTPLGDKGLGRLGVQRLGRRLEIWTRPKNSQSEHYLAISWGSFLNQELLSDVPVVLETTQNPEHFKGKAHGTRILVSHLVNKDVWLDGDTKNTDLRTRLSQMISPYREVEKFLVVVTVNGRTLDLADIAERMREASQVRYNISFDKKIFSCRGRVKLDYFRPENNRAQLHQWSQLVEGDAGQAFFEFLSKKYANKMRDFCIERVVNKKGVLDKSWFVQYKFEQEFIEFDKLAVLPDGQLANPGPFHGEVDSFSIGKESMQRQSVFDLAAAYRDYIKNLNGIRIYRDGFAVRVDEDWLKLGKQQTHSGSFYGLRPGNTLGYIAISARDNAVLEETTDREGFKDTPHLSNFLLMLNQWVRFTEQVQDFLRRGWNEFKTVQGLERPEQEDTTESIVNTMTKTMEEAQQFVEPLSELVGAMDEAIYNAQKTLDDIRQAKDAPVPEGQPSIQEISSSSSEDNVVTESATSMLEGAVLELKSKGEEARHKLAQLEVLLRDISRDASLGQVLNHRVEVLRNQLAEIVETVSLGLTVEVISHDMQIVAEELTSDTKKVRQHLRKQNIRDSELITYIAHVESSINALLKQLSRFNPALRYMREQREDIKLLEFFNDQREFFSSRFKSHNIHLEIFLSKKSDFILTINRGKLVQVIDNLLLNSEYWLREEQRVGRIKSGVIRVDLSEPFVRISDNGPGIATNIESTLFEPFVTTKGMGKGRGLGLYIIQQLLDSENCSVLLSPQKNSRGRRYIFEIDFSGALKSNIEAK